MNIRLNVSVFDAQDRMIEGARVEVLASGSLLVSGTVGESQDTPVQLDIEGSSTSDSVTLVATVGKRSQTKTVVLDASNTNCTFRFRSLRRIIIKFAIVAVGAIIAAVTYHEIVFPQMHANVCENTDIFHKSASVVIPGYVQGPKSLNVVIFVHGIRDNGTQCWTNSHGQYWPSMVAHEYPGWDVYVSEYQDDIHVHEIANSLELRLSDVMAAHTRVVFVAHSMGGLVVREYLLVRQQYMKKVPAILLLATPSLGSPIATIAAVMHLGTKQSDDLQTVDVNPFIKRQAFLWSKLVAKPLTFCFYETRRMWFFEVVSRESAGALCDGEPIPVDAGHSSIAKPDCPNSDQHLQLRKLLDAAAPNTALRRVSFDVWPRLGLESSEYLRNRFDVTNPYLTVVVYGAKDFDIRDIDFRTIRLIGGTGPGTPAVLYRGEGPWFYDVNRDGARDMVILFDVPVMMRNSDLAVSTTSLRIVGYFRSARGQFEGLQVVSFFRNSTPAGPKRLP